MDRTTSCGDMAIWNFSKMAAAAILDVFELEIASLDPPSPKTPPITIKHEVDRTTGCGDIASWNFSNMVVDAIVDLIERRYLRFEQIQDSSRRHVGKISNGHISATGRPIHFMFGYRVGFSGTADRTALFTVRTNPRWQPPPCWKNLKWPYLRNRSSDPLHVLF